MQKQKRRITIADLKAMQWVNDPRLAPNGKHIAYVSKEVDPENDRKYISHLWLTDREGKDVRQLSAGPKTDNNPRWSPDGCLLAFNSNRGGKNQIWLLPTSGGEARQLTSGREGAGAAHWSPDGNKIAYVARVGAENEVAGENASDVKVISRLRYKLNGQGFLGDKYAQIFVVDVATGQTKQITWGNYDCSSPTWSPCSQQLAFSSNRTAEPDYNNQTDIWLIDADGGQIKRITPGKGPSASPTWSPCGRFIAYLGHDNKYKGATLSRIMVVAATGGQPHCLTANFDRSPGNASSSDMVATVDPGLSWSKDGHIYFLASDGPRTKVYRVKNEAGAEVESLSGDENQVVYGFSLAPDGDWMALAVTDPSNIGDIFSLDLSGKLTKLTAHNEDLLKELDLTMPESFTCESDGMTVEGWVMKPVGFKEGVKYPAVLEIHGGPHVAYGYTFVHEFHLLCAAGYAVIFTNPPGSQAYGQEFLIQTHHDWGGKDYRGLMAAVDHVSKYDYIDKERLGVTGGSYGGYMTNWIIGQDQRFRAAVTQRSTSNRYSMFGTSDIGFMNGQFEFMANPWDNPEFYLERSPITYVNKITTPLLLIHSEEDLRCPMEQAEQFYTALKWLRKEAVLVRFPNENHELSRSGQPRHRRERLEHILNWFKKYIETVADEYEG